MNLLRHIIFFCFVLVIIFCCNTNEERANPDFNLQKNDSSNFQSILGRELFFDARLSVNQSKSCASCHNPRFAFTDGYRTNTGSYGDPVLHNTPGLVNVSFLHYLDWAKPSITTFEMQVQRPLYNAHPVELGFNVELPRNIARFQKDSNYISLFKKAFYNGKIDETNVETALVSFVRSLNSFNSPYDRYISGDSNAINSIALQGLELFAAEKLNCAGCHPPPLFTLNTKNTTPVADAIFINTGLYNVLDKNTYPEGDQGVFDITGLDKDKGRFKIPSLRNAALTAPYFHDGSAATLSEVIDIYSRGGRQIVNGPLKGDGKNNLYKDKRIHGFAINEKEKRALLAFLYSLTDSSVLVNPLFTAPVK